MTSGQCSKVLLGLAALVWMSAVAWTNGCAPPPPTLNPAAVNAWKQHEIQKDLDLIRDIAQDANAQVPPLISTEATRRITLWHQTAIQLVHDAPAGWKQTVLTGLDSLKDNVPAAEYKVIAQYVALAKVIVQEAS